MKVVIVIPARYASTRLPGKPLADINGKPMIWWVYERCKKVTGISGIVVAADNALIKEKCDELSMNCIMTSNQHENHVLRIAEVSQIISADYYVCVNGDEPLIDHESIQSIIPNIVSNEIYAGYSIRPLYSISQAMDTSNIKVVRTLDGKAMYLSRTLIPYPKGTADAPYYKLIGVECFNKQALDFYSSHKMGNVEKIEDIDHLRFIENGIQIYTTIVQSESISVDTSKDLEYVRSVLKNAELEDV